ncbi:signal peptidase I SipW [Bacillus niameyensis]|uniref:signal peptidase I SipW n=1 Tax=Bacillus niameyensis TaxID=1522308 RepID=UPI000783F769|nr:signal peptidase I [Bacillus niameyensis]
MKRKMILTWINRIISTILFLLLISIVFVVIASRAAGGEPSLFGYQLKSVLSGSMEPAIQTGSIIAIQLTDDRTSLKEGDVITFKTKDNILITHRIIEIKDNGQQYITQGDNNNAPDVEPVLAQNIVGKYKGLTIPFVGYALQFINTKQGALLVLIIPGILFLGHAIWTIWRAIQSIEPPKRTPIHEE